MMVGDRSGSNVVRQHRRWKLAMRLLAMRLLAMLLVASLSVGLMACSRGDRPTRPAISSKQPASVSRLAEVAPPEILQALRQEMDIYQPQVKILNLRPNQVLEDDRLEVRFQVRDLPVFKDATLGVGPHLHVILDNEPYRPVYNLDEPLVLEGLTPGTHTLRVFASRPWHESFKNEGAYTQLTFHVFTKTGEHTPDPSLPLLTYSRPVGTYGAEPILLDFVLTNAPLHLIAQERSDDEIKDWKIRCTINGERFTFDTWQPIYLTGLKPGKNWVQLELMDEDGQAIANTFNNTVRVITYEPGGSDTLSKLSRNELDLREARAAIIPNYVPPEPEPRVEPPVEPEPTPEPDLELEPEISPEPEPVPALEPEPLVPDAPSRLPAPLPSPELEPLVKEAPALVEPELPAVEPRGEDTAEPDGLEFPATDQPDDETIAAPSADELVPPPPAQPPEKPARSGLKERLNRLRRREQPPTPTEDRTPEERSPSPLPVAPVAPSAPIEPQPIEPQPVEPLAPDGLVEPSSTLVEPADLDEDLDDEELPIPIAPIPGMPTPGQVTPTPAAAFPEASPEPVAPVPAIAPNPTPETKERSLPGFFNRLRRPTVAPVRPIPSPAIAPEVRAEPEEELPILPDFEPDVDNLPKALPENLFVQPEPIKPSLQIPAELVSPSPEPIPAPSIPAELVAPEQPPGSDDAGLERGRDVVEDVVDRIRQQIEDLPDVVDDVPILSPVDELPAFPEARDVTGE